MSSTDTPSTVNVTEINNVTYTSSDVTTEDIVTTTPVIPSSSTSPPAVPEAVVVAVALSSVVLVLGILAGVAVYIYRRRKREPVQLLVTLSNGKFYTSDKTFISKLKTEAAHGVKGVKVTCYQGGAENVPLTTPTYNLVLCVNVTRVASDISAAMELVHNKDHQHILVVFHHISKESEEAITPTEEAISSSVGNFFAHVCDVRYYSSEGGWYDCQENKRAVESTADFLKDAVGKKP